MLEEDFKNVINLIINDIKETQIMILSDANKRLINLYYKIGKIIDEKSTWGNHFIEELSNELKLTFPNIKGFSERNLSRMKRFYLEYKNYEILPPAVAKLPWSHNNILIDKIKDKDDNDSIGLLLCKEKNKMTVEYSLKSIDKAIGVSSYQVSKILPKNLIDNLPTEEELNLHIDMEE